MGSGVGIGGSAQSSLPFYFGDGRLKLSLIKAHGGEVNCSEVSARLMLECFEFFS